MIPSRALVLFSLGPLVLSFATLLDHGLVWAMIAVDIAVLLVAGVDALLARRPLVSVARFAPSVLSVGRPNVVRLELRSAARRRLDVRVTDDLWDSATCDELPLTVRLEPRGHAETRYRVVPHRRGAYALGDHTVRYPSPLGFFIRQLRLPARNDVRVYPDVQAVRSYELLARRDKDMAGVRSGRRRGGESDFERLREYRREDEYRAIDWRATARHTKLIAREYQIEQNQNVVFALDAGGLMSAEVNGLSIFDHALNATLMLSHVASRGGDHVGLVAFAEGIVRYAPVRGGAQAAGHIVRAAYDLYPDLTESNFNALFTELSFRVRRRTLVVLFTQVVDEIAQADLLRLASALMPRHLPLIVILRDTDLDDLVEGRDPETRAGDDRALYLRGAAAELVTFRDRLTREMKRRGALVLDVAPRDLTPALVNRYLDVKARHLL